MKRLWGSLVVLGLVFGLIVSACAPTGKPAPPPTTSPLEKPATTQPTLTKEQQLIEAAKKEGEVVWWSSFQTEPEKVIKAFQDKYPSIKLKYWDARSQDIMVKLVEEAKVGKLTPDVVALTENDIVENVRNGVTQEYEWPNTKGWSYQPNNNYYRVLEANFRPVLYNTDLVSPGEVPKSWEDLKDPKWARKAFVTSTALEAPLALARMWGEAGKLNWERSESFWTDFVTKNRPMVVSGYSGAAERVAAGELPLFVYATSSSSQMLKDRGAPLEFAPISPQVAVPFGLFVVKGSPHPNAAKVFADFLTSPDGLAIKANANRTFVFDPEIGKRVQGNQILLAKHLDFVQLSPGLFSVENRQRSSDFWSTLLGRK